MLKGKIRVLLSVIAFLSLPALASEQASGDAYSCDVYTDKAGYLTPEPFSSTICPKDKALMTTLYHFPSTMEAAINLSGLKYKNEIVSYIKNSNRKTTGNQTEEQDPSSSISYQNDISNFEESSIALRELCMWLIGIIVAVQFVGLAFVAMRSGEVGGKKYGMFKTFSRMAIGFILLTPISVFSEVSGTSSDVLFIQLIMGIAVLGAIGMGNIAISTSAYIMTSDVEDSKEYVTLDSSVAEGIANIASIKSRILIEDAVCANQTSLLGVYNGAAEDGQGSAKTLGEGGAGFIYSTIGDKNNTLIEYSFDENAVNIQTGFNLDSEGNIPYVCSESTISKPSFYLPSHTLSDENYNKLKSSIEHKANEYTLNDVGSIDKTKIHIKLLKQELSNYLASSTDDLVQGAVNAVNIVSFNSSSAEELMPHVINYFFDLLHFRLNGGFLAEQNQEALDLFDKRAKLADEFSKMLIEMKCYAYRNDYQDTENTINALNGGSIGSGDFSLKCAVADGNKLAMPYEASTDSINSYITDTLKVATKNQTKLQDTYVSLYQSFDDYDAKLEIARYEATKENAIAVLRQSMTDEFDAEFNKAVRNLREQGLASFAFNSMNFTRLATQSLNRVIDNKFTYTVGANIPYKASYSFASNFLPANISFDDIEANDFVVQMPEFIYVLPEDNSSIEDFADAQIFTQQGGTFSDSGNRVDLTEYNDEAVKNLLGKSQTQTLIDKSKMSIDSDFNAILSQYTGVSFWGNDALQELFRSSENYFSIVSQCGVPNAEEGIHEEFGDAGVKLFASVCYRYTQHYIFFAQDTGAKIIDYALGMLLAVGVGSAVNLFADNISREAAKNHDGSVSDHGDSDKQSGNRASREAAANNKKHNKLNELVDKFDSKKLARAGFDKAAFITKLVAAAFLLVGFAMAFLTPLIPIVTHLLSYLGWIMLVFQLMIISSIIVLTFFMFTDQDDPSSSPEKASTGAFLNILFRPVTIVIGVVTAFMLSYVAYIMLDLTVSNMVFGINSTTDVFAFNPIKIILATVTLTVIAFSYVYLLKTIFDVSLKAPNNILKKMGAETVDAREQKASEAVFLLISKSASEAREKLDVSEQLSKKRIKEIIKKSKEKDLADTRYINRRFGESVADEIDHAKNAVNLAIMKQVEKLKTADSNEGATASAPNNEKKSPKANKEEKGKSSAEKAKKSADNSSKSGIDDTIKPSNKKASVNEGEPSAEEKKTDDKDT